MALEVRNKELSSYETSRAERLGKGNTAWVCRAGKSIIVLVMCHYSVYKLLLFSNLFCCRWVFFLFCFLEMRSRGCTKTETNSGHKLCRGGSLSSWHIPASFTSFLFFSLAAQLKTLAHWRVVQSFSCHISNWCSSWQPCLRSGGLLWCASVFRLKAFFLNNWVSIKIEEPHED